VGGLSSLVFLIVGGRLANVGRDRPHDRHLGSGREDL
jgi:hypothetical protein